MLALLAGMVFAYELPLEPCIYDVKVRLEGYLPVLGGINQPVEVDMSVEVRGLPQGENGPLRAVSGLREFAVRLRDMESGEFQPLPLNPDNARAMFPETTVDHTRQGKVLKSNAPQVNVPIRLPGIDFRRLPEMTYLFLEFPEHELNSGDSWSFRRDLGGAETLFKVRYAGIEAEQHRFELTFSQELETYEDRNRNPIDSSEGAAAKVRTRVEGKGTVWFDRAISRAAVTGEAVSTVIPIGAGSETTRRLSSAVTIKLRTNDR